MSLLYLGGDLYNVVGRGPNPVTSSGTVNSLFPLTNLHSGRPRKPSSFSQAVADMRWIVDAQLVADGGFEGTLSENWVNADSGTGVSTQDATPSTGTSSLKMVPGAAGLASRYQDVVVRTGERLRLSASIRQDGSGTVYLVVVNRQTGRYLHGDGEWGAPLPSGIQTAGDTSGMFVGDSQEFQVESRAACGGLDWVALRVQTWSSENLTAYFDDIEIVPALNFLGVFGHNLTPVVAPTWRSDSAGGFGSASTRGLPTIRRPNMYSYLTTPVYARYWDLLLSGIPLENPRGGELVMGYAETLLAAPAWGFDLAYRKDQARTRTPFGDLHVSALSETERRVARWGLPSLVEAEVAEVLQEVEQRCGFGEKPLVVLDDVAGEVIHGRLSDSYSVRRAFLERWEHGLYIEEDAHMDWTDG